MDSFKRRDVDQQVNSSGSAPLLVDTADLRPQNEPHALKFKVAVLGWRKILFQFQQPSWVGKVRGQKQIYSFRLGLRSHIGQGQIFTATVGVARMQV